MSSQEEEARNEILKRISTFAYAHPEEKVKAAERTVKASKYDACKWFFVLPEEYAEDNKYNVGPEQLPEEPFNIEIANKVNEYKSLIGEPVKYNIDRVAEFILDDITPLLLGLDGGMEQAKSIIRSTISDIDNYPFLALELLTREAIKLKLSKFITEYFELPLEESQKLVEKILPPKQREVVVPVPMEGSRYEGLNARRQPVKETKESSRGDAVS